MVQLDLGHRAHDRADDVRAVESPAEADLDHADLGPTRGEVGQSNCRGRLEKRRAPLPHQRLQAIGPHGDGCLADRLAVHLHAFPERHQMRRGVEADPPSRFTQRGRNQGADAPLPVGPSHMDQRHDLVRIAHFRQQRSGRRQPELDGRGPREEEVEGLVVRQGHESEKYWKRFAPPGSRNLVGRRQSANRAIYASSSSSTGCRCP